MKIQTEQAIVSYYKEFLVDEEWSSAIQYSFGNRLFKIRAVGVPFLYFGIDDDVYKSIKKEKISTDYEKWYVQFKEAKSEAAHTSIGPDGLILMERREKLC